MATVFVKKERTGHNRLLNNTGSGIVIGQLVVLAGFVAIADEAVANGSIGSFHTEGGLELEADGLTAGNTFATENQAVYLDASGDFSDLPAAGWHQVGNLVKDKATGVITFIKLERAVPCNGLFATSGSPTNNDTLKFVAATGLWTVVAVAD